MNILTAGPWIGEFGWELFCWQSFLRTMSKKFDQTYIASRPGTEYLYKDFCTEFIPFDADINTCSAQSNFAKKSKNVFKNIKGCTHISPRKLKGDQEFIKYGKEDPTLSYDIVMHARAIKVDKTTRWGQNKGASKEVRNWHIDKWNILAGRLSEIGLRMCSIGIPSASYHVNHTDNLTGISLERLADVMASSHLAIGPSSGPLHFASLCGCSHFVWTASRNKVRYEKLWNPLQTPVRLHIDNSWNPKVDSVYQGVMESLNEI